jgi:hypothetical protein
LVRPSTSSLLQRPWHTQDRTPPVQLHQPQLARKTADLARGHHQPDQRYHQPHRPRGLRPARRARLPRQGPGHRRRTGRRQPPPRRLPPRLELHHQTPDLKIDAS